MDNQQAIQLSLTISVISLITAIIDAAINFLNLRAQNINNTLQRQQLQQIKKLRGDSVGAGLFGLFCIVLSALYAPYFLFTVVLSLMNWVAFLIIVIYILIFINAPIIAPILAKKLYKRNKQLRYTKKSREAGKWFFPEFCIVLFACFTTSFYLFPSLGTPEKDQAFGIVVAFTGISIVLSTVIYKVAKKIYEKDG